MSESGRGALRDRSSCRGSGHVTGQRSKTRNFNSNSNINRNSNRYDNKEEMKIEPHGHQKPQQVTYATVKDAIVQNTKKNISNG